jgi:ribosomal protein S18 acetylase RimI-like enzyme
VNIRLMKPGDARSVAEIRVKTWQATYRGLLDDDFLDKMDIEEDARRREEYLAMANTSVFTLVAEDGQKLIRGYCIGGPERNNHPIFTGEIYALYILPQYQNQGLGRRLVIAGVKELIHRGHQGMIIAALAGNQARGFYEHLGGKHIGQRWIELGDSKYLEVEFGWNNLQDWLAQEEEVG